MIDRRYSQDAPTNNEDKQAWCEYGEYWENQFCNFSHLYGIDANINPEKKKDKYAIDLVVRGLERFEFADLKRVQEPFFKCARYGYQPRTTVTLNHKDYIHYRYKYPAEFKANKLAILFWVTWPEEARFGHHVKAVDGLWLLSLEVLDLWIRKGRIMCHDYEERKQDSGTNAKSSWMIDLRQCKFLRKIKTN